MEDSNRLQLFFVGILPYCNYRIILAVFNLFNSSTSPREFDNLGILCCPPSLLLIFNQS